MLLPMALAACLAVGRECPVQQTSAPSASNRSRQPLTLADAIARARERSPLVAAARQRADAAERAQQMVPRLLNPLIELRGENYGPGAEALPRDLFATISQPLELAGKRGARAGTVQAAGAVAAAETLLASWMASLDAAGLYLDALRAREVMATLVTQRESMGGIVAILAERVREGVSPEADLRKFDIEYTRLTSQIARTSVAIQSALLRLAIVVGGDVRAEDLVMPMPMESALPASAPVDASIANRPDVVAAVARLERADASAAWERMRARPDVTVTGGYKRTAGYDTAVAAVTMPVPLFERNRVAVAQALGETAAARIDVRQVRQQALADAQARWAAARELGVQADRASADLLDPAAVVRTAARAAFFEGRGDILQLVDAERVYGDASREAIELRLDAARALVHARLAIGETALP